jgi:predicted ArsR family transcriptional regulator
MAEPIANSTVHRSWFDVLTDPVRLALLRSLTDLHTATATELVGHSHVSYRAAHRHLAALVTLGLVREEKGAGDGESPGRPASRFTLDPRTRESALALFEVLSAPLGPWPRQSQAPPPGR